VPLPIAFGVRQAKAREDDRKILECEIFRREFEAMPIREGGWSYPVARNDPLVANSQPVEGRTERRLYRAKCGTGPPIKISDANRTFGESE
jgi:hypothetical protein